MPQLLFPAFFNLICSTVAQCPIAFTVPFKLYLYIPFIVPKIAEYSLVMSTFAAHLQLITTQVKYLGVH